MPRNSRGEQTEIPCGLFDAEDPTERYTVIATNRRESAEEVVKWCNQRGESSENRIKELKIGFGMDRMPCGQFEANAVFFRGNFLGPICESACVSNPAGLIQQQHPSFDRFQTGGGPPWSSLS
jgi:hypothetical protein